MSIDERLVISTTPDADAPAVVVRLPSGATVSVGTPTSSTASAPAQTPVTGVASIILAANANRKRFMVQNTGLTTLYLAFGSTNPTVTAYHVALKACTGADDGSGGAYLDDQWTGTVRAIGSGPGGTCVVTELT